MPLHDRTVSTHMNDPISRQAIDEIVRGTHGAPFDVLGPHLIEPGELVPELVPKKASSQRGRRGDANAPRTVQSVVRAFFPGAKSATIIPLADGLGNGADGTREATAPETATGAVPLGMLPMRLLHPAGFFSGGGVDDFTCTPYAIEVEYDVGVRRRIRDPYAFAPQLSDFVLHLLGEGTDYEAYHHLGAHPRIVNGVAGVCFAVWAPNAKRVSVVGEFNHWDERVLPMRLRSGGIWELFVPDLISGMLYKYAILSWNMTYRVQKADPYAFGAEIRPGTASRVCNLDSYAWQDQDWMHARASRDSLAAPMSIYEVHAGSWQPDAAGEEERHTAGPVSYRGLAHQLVPYLLEMGYTHVELMPIAEYPFDGSWGYQVTGYYAPTSRYGVPQDFMYFVDYCHRHNIGVLLDWVPAHFPKDEHGLNYFDGSHLYEHADPRLGEHPDWGTLVFNFGRNEVANFLLANALFWLDMYHIDGLRVDAVASMLYLDYSRKAGEWMPNRHGGRENLEAVAFVRRFNELVHGRFPGTITIAEESTAWPMVSRPTYLGGLGFTYKWNMGWMHDILRYFAHDPIHRRFHHNELTFSLMYAFSENFILPFSHDEVVHIKGSLLNKMPGDVWQKTANLRALYAYMYGHPGKKLLFMGGEFGQWSEWNYAGWLDWHLLNPAEDGPSPHAQLQRLICDLNHLLRTTPALFERDFSPEGFEWIDCSDAENSIVSFMRSGVNSGDSLLIVCNFTPVPRYGYRVGVPKTAFWTEVLNTDSKIYGGSNVGNQGGVRSDPIAAHGHAQSILLTLPPLATMFFRSDPSEIVADAGEADKIPTTDTAPSHAEVSSRPRQSGARTSRASTSVNAPRQRDRMSVKARQAWDVNQHDATLG